ncbi:MAG: preprotein translocase subunit SecG [Alphaproteobacteria bacterium]
MTKVILVIHVILAISMIGVVLLQRSEGGALGIGGGGGGGGLLSGRSQANLLTRATAVLAGLFMLTSLTLTMMAGNSGEQRSIVDDIQVESTTEAPAEPAGPSVPIAD